MREVPWLTLELEKPSLVVAIGFGKYLKREFASPSGVVVDGLS